MAKKKTVQRKKTLPSSAEKALEQRVKAIELRLSACAWEDEVDERLTELENKIPEFTLLHNRVTELEGALLGLQNRVTEVQKNWDDSLSRVESHIRTQLQFFANEIEKKKVSDPPSSDVVQRLIELEKQARTMVKAYDSHPSLGKTVSDLAEAIKNISGGGGY